MAQFDEHIKQAKKNLVFLSEINQKVLDCYDWQVTTCFYTALHLVNAHLANQNMQYRKHVDVKFALNPENALSLAKIDENTYVSYISLQSLSRRSRYLVEEGDNGLKSNNAFFTYEKHLAKSLRHLDKIILYFSNKYNLDLPKQKIICENIRLGELQFAKN